MAEFKVKLRFLRCSPFKARLIADLIRGKSAEEALNILTFLKKRHAVHFKKLIKAGIASASSRGDVDTSNLYIKELFVDQGPTLKRVKPMARGRAGLIRKRTCHITLKLAEA